MQKQLYSPQAGTSNAFSGSRPWWSIRAQWAVLAMAFERPDNRSARNYPTAAVLQHVALVLCLNAAKDTGMVWMSVGSVARQLRRSGSRRSIQRALRALEIDFGVLELVRREGPSKGRSYRICIGFAEPDAVELQDIAPNKIVALKKAYRRARLETHNVGTMPKPRPVIIPDVIACLEEVCAFTGATFEDVANDAMDIFMECRGMDDGKLVTEFHPLDWIRPYLPKIERRLRRAHARSQQPEAAPAPAPAAPTPVGELAAGFAAMASSAAGLKKAGGDRR